MGDSGYTSWLPQRMLESDLSTIRFYKNGSLFNASAADKTAPDSDIQKCSGCGPFQMPPPITIMASPVPWMNLRLYRVALSADEVAAAYSETNATTWYTIGAINSTNFSATGHAQWAECKCGYRRNRWSYHCRWAEHNVTRYRIEQPSQAPTPRWSPVPESQVAWPGRKCLHRHPPVRLAWVG